MPNLDWIKKLEKPEELLQGDAKIISEMIGLENMIKFFNQYGTVPVYFTVKDFNDARIEYIKQNYDNTRICKVRICRDLNISGKTFDMLVKGMRN